MWSSREVRAAICVACAVICLPLGALAARADEPRVTMDVKDAPLLVLTLQMSEICEQNFVLLDSELENKRITIYAPEPLPVPEACELFLTALQMHGLIVVDEGSYWKIDTL